MSGLSESERARERERERERERARARERERERERERVETQTWLQEMAGQTNLLYQWRSQVESHHMAREGEQVKEESGDEVVLVGFCLFFVFVFRVVGGVGVGCGGVALRGEK